MKTPGIILVSSCFLAALAADCFAIADKEGPKIGDAPPPLALTKTIQGSPAADISWDKLKGKAVVLEFWATWCGPCVKAIPHLNDLADQFKNRPVAFISVTSENEDVVRLFLKNHPIKSTVGLDDFEVLNKAFHIAGIPHAVIVDAAGRIVAITHPAKIKPENIEEILAGKKCSLPEPEIYTVGKGDDDAVSNQAPALFEISIREHKMPQKIRGPIGMWSPIPNNCGYEGRIATIESALNSVFGKSPDRMVLKCKMPDGFYDFELRSPPGHVTELQNQFIAALHTTFSLDVKQTTKTMDCYVMNQLNTNAPGLHKVEKRGSGGQMNGGFRLHGSDMNGVAQFLEMDLRKPVFNETGLKDLFDVDMKWKLSEAEIQKDLGPDPRAVIDAARERLGLQLTLVQRPVEILEVSKAPQ